LDAEALITFHNDRGYRYASISYDVVNTSDTQGNVIFDIDKGQKFRIGKTEFIRNDVVKESEFVKAMRTKKWSLLSIFKKAGVYRPDDFNAELEIIKTVFRDHR
jgi:outer membrane protein assembly factor BamA